MEMQGTLIILVLVTAVLLFGSNRSVDPAPTIIVVERTSSEVTPGGSGCFGLLLFAGFILFILMLGGVKLI